MYFVLHFNFFHFLFHYVAFCMCLCVCVCVHASPNIYKKMNNKIQLQQRLFVDLSFYQLWLVDERRQFLMEMFNKHAFEQNQMGKKKGFIQIGFGIARYEITV